MATVAEAAPLITAEQFAQRPDPPVIQRSSSEAGSSPCTPKPRHGYTCNKAGRIFGTFVEEHRRGWVLNNDTGVITDAIRIRSAARMSSTTATIVYRPANSPNRTPGCARIGRRGPVAR